MLRWTGGTPHGSAPRPRTRRRRGGRGRIRAGLSTRCGLPRRAPRGGDRAAERRRCPRAAVRAAGAGRGAGRVGVGRRSWCAPSPSITTPVSPAVGYRFDYKGRSLVVSGDTKKSANLSAQARASICRPRSALARARRALKRGRERRPCQSREDHERHPRLSHEPGRGRRRSPRPRARVICSSTTSCRRFRARARERVPRRRVGCVLRRCHARPRRDAHLPRAGRKRSPSRAVNVR